MKVKSILKYLFLSVTVSTKALAQDGKDCDSLIKALGLVKEDNQKRAKAYYAIAKCYQYSKEDRTFAYADSAIQFAKLASDTKLESDAYSLQGVVYKNRGELKNAIDRHLLALKLKE